MKKKHLQKTYDILIRYDERLNTEIVDVPKMKTIDRKGDIL